VDASLLTSPFDSLAYRDGFVRLSQSGDLYRRFQSNCVVTTRRWAKANRQTLVDAIKAKLSAFQWISSSANLRAACEILRSHDPELDDANAQAAINDLKRSFQPSVRLFALNPVLELRARYAEPRHALKGPEAYIDMSFYRQARLELAARA
jgi:ABC-type nitrate/sulfonate/bicarbonate transport system substrate-binding protein